MADTRQFVIIIIIYYLVILHKVV